MVVLYLNKWFEMGRNLDGKLVGLEFDGLAWFLIEQWRMRIYLIWNWDGKIVGSEFDGKRDCFGWVLAEMGKRADAADIFLLLFSWAVLFFCRFTCTLAKSLC